jgi:hypothetical protein
MADRDDGDGFLSRWSRRKANVAQREVVAPEASEPSAPPPVRPEVSKDRAEPVEARPALPADPSTGSGRTEAAAPPPPPTLEDVAQLTAQSDFSRFVAPDVDTRVKNAAMKKLFADPHFNVMDGLDTYIDDYNKFEPIPKSMLRQLVSARVLGLIDDELEEQPKPEGVASAADNPLLHEDADLQLQPVDAAGQPGAGESLAGPADPGDAAHDPVPPRSA